MDINLVNEDTQLDDDGNPIDLIKSFKIKTSNNTKIIGNFIMSYINYISSAQNIYDELTNENITLKITSDNQTSIENTLRTMEWLNKDVNDELYKITLMKMRMKQINYSDIYNVMQTQYGTHFLDDDESNLDGDANLHNIVNTQYDNNNDIINDDNNNDNDNDDDDDNNNNNNVNITDDNDNDNANDNDNTINDNIDYELNEDMPQTISIDDMDDMDMDYDFLGVNDED